MSTGIPGVADWSREAFEAALTPEEVELMESAVAQMPPPSPQLIEDLRRLLAPNVARVLAGDQQAA